MTFSARVHEYPLTHAGQDEGRRYVVVIRHAHLNIQVGEMTERGSERLSPDREIQTRQGRPYAFCPRVPGGSGTTVPPNDWRGP